MEEEEEGEELTNNRERGIRETKKDRWKKRRKRN